MGACIEYESKLTVISFVIYVMVKLKILLTMCILTNLAIAQCDDGEVQIWGECYEVDLTYELNLSGQQLTGTIPIEISQLSNLMFLDVSNNEIEGAIPEELGSIETLMGLNLSHNVLTGNIPDELGNLTNVMILDLSHNELNGSMPSTIGNMTSLVELSIDNNQLGGELPIELGQLPYLSEFNANDNEFIGTIPSEISGMISLDYLLLQNNLFFGPIPESICEIGLNFGNPYSFNIEGNSFCPPYPDCIDSNTGYQDVVECPGVHELFDTLYYAEEITELILPNSGLSGAISPNIGYFTNLISIDLSYNEIVGYLPSEIGSLENLQYLNLSNNQLSGVIPSSIGDLSSLVELKLYTNAFTGTLPNSIGNLANLEYMNVFNNDLSGNIPSEIGNMGMLNKLYLHHNQFDGNIPTELFGLTELVHLYLNNNGLTGELGSNIYNLNTLERLRLQNNDLSGNLPDELCALNLEWEDQASFNVSNNNICAPYPFCIDGYEGEQDTSSCGDVNINDLSTATDHGLISAYPNPFNPFINVRYSFPSNVEVEITISDILGRKVRTFHGSDHALGEEKITWDGKDQSGRMLSTGVYYLNLSTTDYSKTIKVVMIK